MPTRIDYSATTDATSTEAEGTIATLEAQKSRGHITGYRVDYRDDEGELNVHIWHDVSREDRSSGLEELDRALSELPVSLPFGSEGALVIEK